MTADIRPFPAPGPPDAGARADALNLGRSWIVDAPAGSGKTGLIIQRYLKLLAHPGVDDPGQVLAITFTRKATFEMRDRVLAQLAAAAAGTPLNPAEAFNTATRPLALAVLVRDRELSWNLLEQPRRLNIRTIDSVCSEIAASLPVLSRSGGGVAPSDDAASLYAEAARRTAAELGGPDAKLSDALAQVLLHRDGNLRECKDLIASMLAWREQWAELIPLSPAELDDAFLDATVLPRFERALELAICSTLTRVVHALPVNLLEDLCELAANLGHLDGYGGNPSPLAFCAGNSTPPEGKAAQLDHWRALVNLLLKGDGNFRATRGLSVSNLRMMVEPTHRRQLGELLDRVRDDEDLRRCLCATRALPPAHYPPDQWRVAKDLFRVLGHALIELQIVFAERGECDFAEVGLLARAALRQHGAADALRVAAGHSLQHLLVDEMQDTSSSQYELIELLTQGWDGHSQTVFLVGDPKQSIYLFRQARVERFVRTLRLGSLGQLRLGVLHLTANFRSQANLVGAFNDDFSRIFPAEAAAEPGQQTALVTYRRADPVLALSSPNPRVWHTAVLAHSTDADLGRKRRLKQARRFALDLRHLVEEWRMERRKTRDRTEKPPTLAVLVRSRSHLLEIVRAFKDSSSGPPIPFRAVEVEALAERQEVLDLVALTRALLHPADRVAWLALLRSPLCGLTLADLHRLSGNDDSAFRHAALIDLIRDRGDLLSADAITRLEPFWSILASALDQRGTLRLSTWVDRTFRAFGGYAFTSEEAQANIAQYLNLLDQLEEPGGTLDLRRLDTRMARLFAAPSVHPGAVDLMTIHGAKGLEWDVVFVPALERVGQSSRDGLLTWLELDADPEDHDDAVAHGILAPIQSRGAESEALNRWIRAIASAREQAERSRLFYVAATRAREQLHLFAAPVRSSKGEVQPKPSSLLAAAWPAAQAAVTSKAAPSNLVIMPASAQPDLLFQLAAAAAAPTPAAARTVQRIPLAHLAATVASNAYREAAPAATERRPLVAAAGVHAFARSAAHASRPEGSFVARVFGNTVHALLEQCAARLARGLSPDALLAELPTWTDRITALVRASGLSAAEIARQAAAVRECLQETLADPHGRWILAPHPGARSESAQIAWRDQRASLRLDRTFLAGAEPLSSGSTHLWIVDFKTSARGRTGLDEFLLRERATHAPQLQRYAHELSTPGRPIRLALYYPRLTAFDLIAYAEH